MGRSFLVSQELNDYIHRTWVRESDLLRELREETSRLENSGMQISPDQGQLMALLVSAIGARRCLEIGVFTGYSSLVVASALPPDGQLVALDISDEYTQVARRYWDRAGVASKIQLRIGPALDSLVALIGEGAAGSFDFAFIDADKTNYANYFEKALELVKTGGLIAVDNVLWHGDVADEAVTDEQTEAIRKFNARLVNDERVQIALVPIGDGLTLARKL